MASLVTGLFDLASGDPAEKEQKQFGALGDYQTGTGEALTTAGAGYDLGILSGDPSKIATALAPEISTGQGQVEQQLLQDANFGNRAGGTNASTQNAENMNRKNIIDLEGGLQSGAASSALSAGGGLLSDASSNIGNEANLAEQRRSQLTQDVGGIATGAAEIATGLFGRKTVQPEQLDPGTFDSLMQSGTVQPEQLDLSAAQPEDLSAQYH